MENNQKPQEVEIEKMLTPDMAKAIDMLGYLFLKEKGFDTDRCSQTDRKGASARNRLKRAIAEKGYELTLHLPTSDNKIFAYFTLDRLKDGRKMASSRTIEFDCKVIEVTSNGGKKESE